MADRENLKKGDLMFKTDNRSVFEFGLGHHLRIEQNIFSEFRRIEAQLMGMSRQLIAF